MKKKVYSLKKLSDNELSSEGIGYVRNMLCVDGINKKRNGWRAIGVFRSEEGRPLKINGIFEYCTEEKSVLVVHAGNDFYECGYDLSIITKIPVSAGLAIKNEKSNGYMYDGYLWITCQNGLLIYDGETIYSPYEKGFAYVPTTSIGIGERGKGLKPIRLESENLLTRRRKNCLRGVQEYKYRHVFRLDATAEYGKPFSIEATFRVKWEIGKSDEWTSRYVGINIDENTVVHISIYVPSLLNSVMIATPLALDECGNEVAIEEIEYAFQVVNGRDLILDFDAVSPYEDFDNITVEFTEFKEKANLFENVRLSSVGSTENGKATMVVSCGDNKLYYSRPMGELLYFPGDCAVTVGKDAQKITGIIPMVNNYVGIYKEHSFYTLKIGAGNGEYFLYLSDNSIGCACADTVKSIGNDSLALSYLGVLGVSETDNAELEVARLYNRSRSIKNELESLDKTETEQAFAIVNKGEYWLFVGGRVYICTPRYKIKGESSKAFSYQWWVLDNCPSTCAAFARERLYMGREDGNIVIFDDEYTDREIVTLYTKDADLVFTQDDYLRVTFNSCFDIKSGDSLSLSKHYYYALDGEYRTGQGFVYVPPGRFLDENGCVALYSGMKIRLCTLDNEVVYDGEILDTYPDVCGIYLGEIGLNTDTPLMIYYERDEKTEYELLESDDGFMVTYNKMPVSLLDADIEKAYITRKQAVECELITNLTDLGTRELKTLYGISITPTEDTRCSVDIGFETKNGSFGRAVTVNSTIDFEDFDYKDPVFSPVFKQSITVPFFERNFEYIKIKIGSRNGGVLGLENISIIYSTKK